ncbi:MAG: hypothetical protein MI861_02765 [Pirellulales bacterium]|nr:hypothetical protein [Pirellulales bacterium]
MPGLVGGRQPRSRRGEDVLPRFPGLSKIGSWELSRSVMFSRLLEANAIQAG